MIQLEQGFPRTLYQKIKGGGGGGGGGGGSLEDFMCCMDMVGCDMQYVAL